MLREVSRRPIREVRQFPAEVTRGGGLPRTNLLIYLARPNSDEYLIGEDTEVGEDTYIWGYVLPQSLFSALGAGLFFTAEGVPIVVLASEILADPTINTANIIFQSISAVEQTGRLAIYDPTTPSSELERAYKALHIPFVG